MTTAQPAHPLDALLQSLAPTVVVPRHGAFVPLDAPGQRFLVSSDRLWLELRTTWLYLRYPITTPTRVPMPGGDVTTHLELLYGETPFYLFERFKEQAKRQCPDETGAWITWSADNGFRYYELEATFASGDLLRYKCPDLADGEELVFDLHSHGRHDAFFSPTDDEDDRGHIRFAGVVGNADKSDQEMVMRLCAKGEFIDMDEVFSNLGQH